MNFSTTKPKKSTKKTLSKNSSTNSSMNWLLSEKLQTISKNLKL